MMPHSKPDCRNYISEELCAAGPGRPEEKCCRDDRGECANYTPDVSADVATVTSAKKAPTISLDIE